MAGVFSAFLVAFKHLIPEHRIALLGNAVTIRVKVSNVMDEWTFLLMNHVELDWCSYSRKHYFIDPFPGHCVL